MEEYKHKENFGSLFKNNYKEKENQPVYVGTANVDGVEKKIAAWINETKKGDKYFSIKFSDIEDEKTVKSVKPKAETVSTDDDLPF